MEFKEKKRISVCIAAYQPNVFLLKELESIMPQLSEIDEVIISEDFCTESDVYKNIINTYEGRVKIVFHEHSEYNPWRKWGGDVKGYAVTQNFLNALNYASGEYIFLADQDDIWAPNRVKVMLESLIQNKGSLVVCNSILINENEEKIGNIYYKNPLDSLFPIAQCLKHAPFLGCVMAFDRILFDSCLPFPKKMNTHDTWISLCALQKRKVVVINKPLHFYRIHGNNVSGNSKNSVFFKFVYRFYLLKEILLKRMKRSI